MSDSFDFLPLFFLFYIKDSCTSKDKSSSCLFSVENLFLLEFYFFLFFCESFEF